MRTTVTVVDDAPVDRDKLAAILKCDDATLDKAQRAIVRARGYVIQDATSTDAKALGENLDSLRAALARMQRTLRYMEGNDHFLDEHYCLTNDGDVALMTLRQRSGASSGFRAMVDGMTRAVADFKQESAQPGKQGRNVDGSHTLAIQELADFVRRELPGVKVTHTRGSRFTRLVALALFDEDMTPSTAIKRALAETNP